MESESAANRLHWVAPSLTAARRFVVILALGFWLGGFTFYASVVIHTGHRVFHGQREVGFLTQQVTHWLNLSGAVALVILLCNLLMEKRRTATWMRSGLWLTWLAMVVVQITLFALHPRLDAMLDIETHRILPGSGFRATHNLYMNLSTTQWVAGLLHLWLILLAWRSSDLLLHRVENSLPREAAA